MNYLLSIKQLPLKVFWIISFWILKTMFFNLMSWMVTFFPFWAFHWQTIRSNWKLQVWVALSLSRRFPAWKQINFTVKSALPSCHCQTTHVLSERDSFLMFYTSIYVNNWDRPSRQNWSNVSTEEFLYAISQLISSLGPPLVQCLTVHSSNGYRIPRRIKKMETWAWN